MGGDGWLLITGNCTFPVFPIKKQAPALASDSYGMTKKDGAAGSGNDGGKAGIVEGTACVGVSNMTRPH